MSDDLLRGPLEARLLEVERRCLRIDRDLRKLRRDATGLWQWIWDEWSALDLIGTGEIPTASPPPTANTHFSGKIVGCASLGTTATIAITSGGITLWTGTSATDGTFSGSIYLSSDQALPLSIVPTTERFQPLTTTTGWLIAGTSNTIPTRTLSPASSYHCSSSCPVPLKPTLLLTPSRVYAPFNLVWTAGTPASWIGAPSGSPTSTFQFTSGVLLINGKSGLFTSANLSCSTNTFIFTGNDGSAWAGYTMTITEPS